MFAITGLFMQSYFHSFLYPLSSQLLYLLRSHKTLNCLWHNAAELPHC